MKAEGTPSSCKASALMAAQRQHQHFCKHYWKESFWALGTCGKALRHAWRSRLEQSLSKALSKLEQRRVLARWLELQHPGVAAIGTPTPVSSVSWVSSTCVLPLWGLQHLCVAAVGTPTPVRSRGCGSPSLANPHLPMTAGPTRVDLQQFA